MESETSQRGQVITNYQTAALPLVSRNYSDLIGLTTGVRQTTQSLSSTSNTGLVREGSFNVNGQRSIFNNFLLVLRADSRLEAPVRPEPGLLDKTTDLLSTSMVQLPDGGGDQRLSIP